MFIVYIFLLTSRCDCDMVVILLGYGMVFRGGGYSYCIVFYGVVFSAVHNQIILFYVMCHTFTYLLTKQCQPPADKNNVNHRYTI